MFMLLSIVCCRCLLVSNHCVTPISREVASPASSTLGSRTLLVLHRAKEVALSNRSVCALIDRPANTTNRLFSPDNSENNYSPSKSRERSMRPVNVVALPLEFWLRNRLKPCWAQHGMAHPKRSDWLRKFWLSCFVDSPTVRQ